MGKDGVHCGSSILCQCNSLLPLQPNAPSRWMMEPLKGWVVLQRPDCGKRASTCCCTHDVRVLYLQNIEGDHQFLHGCLA